MRKISLFCFLLVFCACASGPRRSSDSTYVKDAFIELNCFCRECSLTPQYDTIDDMVRLESDQKDIRLLLNSLVTYVNGTTVYLKHPPYYCDGQIYIPRELKNLLSKKITRHKTVLPSVRTVVIDPGHGGKDPGAVSPYRKIKEKDVNLKVSKLLKIQLEQQGFRVYLTRSDDRFLTLQQRTEIAKNRDADLFISIHANANRSRKVSGAEVYYLAPKYFNSEAKSIALAEKSSLNFTGKYSRNTRAIVWDMICTENNAVSLNFASSLVKTFKRLGFHVRPPRGAPFYVLKNAYVPSVLVELGYLTNKDEERLLTSSRYQKQLVEAIKLCVSNYNKSAPQFVKDYGTE